MQISPITLEAARTRCAQRPAWLRALERAAVLAPASTVEPLPAGRYRIVSAHSGASYVTSSTDCTCLAAMAGRPCWHLAAVRLQALETEPRWACKLCGGEMQPSTTIAGEPSLVCDGCGHEVSVTVAAEACNAQR